MPLNIHPAISWSKSNPFPLSPVVDDAKWTLIDKTVLTQKDRKQHLILCLPRPQNTDTQMSMMILFVLPDAKRSKPATSFNSCKCWTNRSTVPDLVVGQAS